MILFHEPQFQFGLMYKVSMNSSAVQERQSRWIGSMTATLIVKTVQTNQTITTTTTTVTTTTTTTMMLAIISAGAVIMTATVNGRVTQTMARTGGPVRRTHLFQSGITGGTTANSMMRIGSVRMNTGKIRITSTQQITTTTTKAMPQRRILRLWMA